MRKVVGALFITLLAVGNAVAHPRVPFERPFGGSDLVEQKFTIRKPHLFAAQLNYGFSSPTSRQSAWSFSGGYEVGAQFSVEVKIISHAATEHPVVLKKLVKAPKLNSWGGKALHAELAPILLSPGSYTLKVRLIGAAAPPGVTLSAGVVIPYRGK